jgi:hypothetical protein
MPHKRSPQKNQLRRIRKIIFNRAFHDQVRDETICRLTWPEVLGLLNEPVLVASMPDMERGDVLADSRGIGTFQRMPNTTDSSQI